MGLHLVTLAVALDPARRLGEAASTGNPDCPCLTSAQRTGVMGWSDAMFQNADGTTKVTLAGIDYSYPADYCDVGRGGRPHGDGRGLTAHPGVQRSSSWRGQRAYGLKKQLAE